MIAKSYPKKKNDKHQPMFQGIVGCNPYQRNISPKQIGYLCYGLLNP